jgi:ATP-dependent protease ClpP protease subunit
MAIVPITGRIDLGMASTLKKQLRDIPDNSVIRLRINSHGGNMYALKMICGFLYFMERYKNCEVHGELIYGESAALDLFLNTSKRFVTNKSIGVIHFPVPKKIVNKKVADRKKRSAIDFMLKRTLMNESEIVKYENIPLNANELIAFGIAERKIEFETES